MPAADIESALAGGAADSEIGTLTDLDPKIGGITSTRLGMRGLTRRRIQTEWRGD